ncbi:transcriptional regulator [Burkholderia cepacia]|nr:transcriptional regulator [Burkholderia cepacia]
MTKYDEQFRQQVVSAYLCGDIGFDALSARHGIHHGMLQRWVAAYRLHGSAALRSKYSSYDAPFKLRVLQHMQRDELSLREVSALYDIRDAGSVARWARLYDEGGINALTPRPRGRPRKMATSLPPKPTEAGTPDERSREELLKENEYLRAEVAYLKKLDALLAKKQAAQKKKRK